MLSICTDDSNTNIMKRLDQGHLHPLLEHHETNMSRPGIEPEPPGATGEHSSKELFKQLLLLLFGTSTVLMTLMFFWVKLLPKLGTLRRISYHPSFISRHLGIASMRSAKHHVARTRNELTIKVGIP